ncbi:sigma-70 family RNA polymerase sigma factor [Pokkaliibacter plantistimulans]|nr:sigma-70 family RNA polymerase sigma factor [Pokkaliibacter plantistimulans]
MDRAMDVTAGMAERSQALLADNAFLDDLRGQMLKFARMQLRDEQLAEDAVQEAFVGALKNAAAFGRRAALKTWVFAILKNKITDILRARMRLVPLPRAEEQSDDEVIDILFRDNGHWHKDVRPSKWQDPDEDMENSQFWQTFDMCLNALPERLARLFMMREFLELETEEICQSEEINQNSLNVSLYRARVRLRECLENHWFVGGSSK